MKKFYVLLAAVLLCNVAISQVVYEEDFSGGTMPAGFTLYNDANQVAMNIAALFPDAWNVLGEPADTANKVAASPSWFVDETQPADRWMITPAISVGPNMTLSWKGKAQDPAWRDGYSVKISTTGVDKADFTIDVVDVAMEDTLWNQRHYDLSALDGEDIHVAFIQNSLDKFYIMINDIKVGVGVGIEQAKPAPVSVTLSPNPATDHINVFSSEMIQSMKVVNTVGQTVMEEVVNDRRAVLDVTGLKAGVYFVVGVTADGSTFTERVIVR